MADPFFPNIDDALLSASPWERFKRWLRWQWIRAHGQGELVVGMDFGSDYCSVVVRRWPDGTLEVVHEDWLSAPAREWAVDTIDGYSTRVKLSPEARRALVEYRAVAGSYADSITYSPPAPSATNGSGTPAERPVERTSERP